MLQTFVESLVGGLLLASVTLVALALLRRSGTRRAVPLASATPLRCVQPLDLSEH